MRDKAVESACVVIGLMQGGQQEVMLCSIGIIMCVQIEMPTRPHAGMALFDGVTGLAYCQ